MWNMAIQLGVGHGGGTAGNFCLKIKIHVFKLSHIKGKLWLLTLNFGFHCWKFSIFSHQIKEEVLHSQVKYLDIGVFTGNIRFWTFRKWQEVQIGFSSLSISRKCPFTGLVFLKFSWKRPFNFLWTCSKKKKPYQIPEFVTNTIFKPK